MASFEEIRHRVDQRLEELLEEATRLRAALEALSGDGAPVRSGLHPGHTTKPVARVLGRDPVVEPKRGSALTRAEPNAVNGNDDTRDPPVERAVRQLRQELAAGLRNGKDQRPRSPEAVP
ncbi:MAG: hypothetical protein JOY56_16640 [Solirubrobacterales bacterium]|nr:hypothetical protein [Solirubrobacterales bacterium]